MTMTTSSPGRLQIRQREGFRLTAYLDSVKVWTIGVGHTGRAAPPKVTEGMRITEAQADAYLAADLVPFEATINHTIVRPMRQGQFDAFASITFNIGAGGFAGSTMARRFNAGDVAGCADAFLLWCKPAVLLARRKAERLQFLQASGAAPVQIPTVPAPVPPPTPALPVPPPTSRPLPPPVAVQPEKASTMPAFIAFFLTLFGYSAAQAADVDFRPLVEAGLTQFAVPLLGAVATWLVGLIGLAAKKYLDQQTAAVLARNVDAVLQKAISYGAVQASTLVANKDFHANVDGWIASYAADYANAHAPRLMKQAGDVTQKVFARLSEHPDVIGLKLRAQNDNAPAAAVPDAQAAA